MSTSATTIPYEELGRPIRGPHALGDDWARFWHLTWNIALNQWKLRFFGSALGYAWQLVRPLLLFTVLWLFFTEIARVGKGPSALPGHPEHFYGAQLLASIVLFTFFAEATTTAVKSVVENEVLVRKIQFPRMVIPLSTVVLAFFNLVLNLGVVLIFALASGVRPMWTWFEIPLILAVLVVFTTGVAMLLSAMYVYFRDISPIWEVLTQVLFYISPVIIPVDRVASAVSPALLHIYMLSPIAFVLQWFRHAVINPATLAPSVALGGPLGVLEPLAIVVAVFALGFYVFNRAAPDVAENL